MHKIIIQLTLAAALVTPFIAQADVSLSINIAPPALPIYAQPAIPGDGYLWTPGYWSWNDADADYYWVPGTWVVAPFVGALWTPGYWGWANGGYAWHGGYWGTHIGYYGGINYGYGYVGVGYQGGHWNNGVFNYNRSVNNVGNRHITNIYNSRVVNTTVNRVSYNGGQGGVRLQPTKAEEVIAGMPHKVQTPLQTQHESAARGNQVQRASVNHGVPKVAATPEPNAFNAPNVVAARVAQAASSHHSPAGNAQHPQARAPKHEEQQASHSEPHPAQHSAPHEGNQHEEEHR
ncbi:YXWGXW repeat-containing protein [Solimicrobium silvestre]|uniref:YXWGXW repeat (2 copies) n=1 Tax=Solimicrobium silvestre TaxID=2099400 RepID=A0A2S9GWT9_9BURK|nr:YXWGXW repeat-containing protein [Solimicrobium silvestre]PRC92168.1 YXWGXW repeat (2 copies) [Solimicrobium silvestre]